MFSSNINFAETKGLTLAIVAEHDAITFTLILLKGCEYSFLPGHIIYASTESRLYLNLSTRAVSFKVKQSFTLMTSVPSTLPFLSSPKVTYSLCDRGVRLENHFLFPVMCQEQLEYVSHVSYKAPAIIYIGREKVDVSVLGLVR
jgi:hypothetical protein